MKTLQKKIGLILLALLVFSSNINAQESQIKENALVLQSDFSLKDGAVSAMQGVAYGVSSNLDIFNLTHEITPYNIWEGSYRLMQTMQYWPQGTVFVSVVDPGVGTDRKSVVAQTNSGHYIVTPNNGTLTLVADKFGIKEVREIDEKTNRLSSSYDSYTFHGRDVYAYTGARLAAGVISFEKVGPSLGKEVFKIEYQQAKLDNNELKGNIPVLDPQYGNVWTNISKDLWEKEFKAEKGKSYTVTIFNKNKQIYQGSIPYVSTFGDVDEGKPLLYLNSLLNISIALNMDSFAGKNNINAGGDWSIVIK